MRMALTRQVSPSLAHCELTHLSREPVDLGLAEAQHARYEACLRSLGCEVIQLPAEPAFPDAVFVEDTALVLDELAVLTRPGAESRRGEVPSIARALEPFRPLARLEAPATLDGGDVLRLGQRLFVGLSRRSNPEAVAQLRRLLAPHGYSVEGVELGQCLHLKSAVTQVAEDTLLLNPAWVHPRQFKDMHVLEVDPHEPFAANALRVGGALIHPAHFPRTRERLQMKGVDVRPVDVSELAKAEGGVTCCSLIFNQPASR